MPGRLTITADDKTLKERYNVSIPDDYDPRYNISPSQLISVILNDNPKTIIMARWGFKSKFIPHPMINARSEDIEHNRVFGKAFRERRCLIPADSYYEWKQEKDGKKPYRIMLKDESIFSIAGVWQDFEGELEFATITISPNPLVGRIHERMPAILKREDESSWLKTADSGLLRTYPAEDMMMYPVSTDVNSSKHDKKEFIKPIGEKISL